MQKAFTRERLITIINQQGGPLVSIYMPTHTQGAEIEQDPIRLNNLLTQATDQLKGRYPNGPDPEKLLQPAWALVDDRPFWRHQDQGLALFISEDTFDVEQLPLSFAERVEVGDRYHVTPLLPLLTSDGEFFLLSLSLGEVHLYQGAQGGLSEIDLPEETPLNLEEALEFDDPETAQQFHTSTRNLAGGRRAMFHGHGADKAEQRANIRRFFHRLSDGVEQRLHSTHAPLVLAGVDELMPIYRETNEYPHLVEENVSGNPQEMNLDSLHAKALEIVLPLFTAERQQAVERFNNQRGSALTEDSLEVIVPAAEAGRIEILFVQQDRHQWGRYDASTHQAHLHEQRQESSVNLIDLAVEQTLKNEGQVYFLPEDEMPIQARAAALFRYTIEQEV